MSRDLRFSKQCLLAGNKVNWMLGAVNGGITYRSDEVISKLYRSYVRPHLECCIQFWSPINEKDADMLERVQRRATGFEKLIIRGGIEGVGCVFGFVLWWFEFT